MSVKTAYYNERLSGRQSESIAVPARGSIDIQFLIITVILLVVGLIFLFSASYPTQYYEEHNALELILHQIKNGVIGLAVMLAASYFHTAIVPYSGEGNIIRRLIESVSIRRYAMFFMWCALIFNVPNAIVGLIGKFAPSSIGTAVIAFGNKIGIQTRNGATRWLFGFQPSEILKIGLIIGLSAVLSRDGSNPLLRNVNRKRGFFSTPFFKTGVVAAIAFALMFGQSHNSGLIIAFVITFALWLTSGAIRMPLAVGIVALVAVVAVVYVSHVDSKWEKLHDVYLEDREAGITHSVAVDTFRKNAGGYFDKRIMAWLHPDFDTQGISYQVNQSLLAVGSGGLLGQGFGKSHQKFFHLPEAENDYIFAIICEESGFIGSLLILFLFALLIIRGFWIGLHARDKFSSLIVIGIMTMIAIQVIFNIGVVTNFLPPTGISLPFFSFGGSALVVQLAEMGIVLSVSREIKLTRRG